MELLNMLIFNFLVSYLLNANANADADADACFKKDLNHVTYLVNGLALPQRLTHTPAQPTFEVSWAWTDLDNVQEYHPCRLDAIN
jgi:hypothetical protein